MMVSPSPSIEPTPALVQLRAAFASAAPRDVRVLRHRGSCSEAAGVVAVDSLDLEVGVPVFDAACDGACWAAPSATVVRAGHRHRFARIARGAIEELVRCTRGECDEPQAGTGVAGITARLGRNDGTLADVLTQGAYAAYARAATLPSSRVVEAIALADLLRRFNARALVASTLEVEVTGSAIDAHLLEGDPHRVIESVLIACRAGGSRAARMHLEGASPRVTAALHRALHDARGAGIVDGAALGGDAVTIEVVESSRGTPVASVASVQTLCTLTTIFDATPPPTRLIALSGDLARPGIYEVPVGGSMTWAGVLATAGTMPARVQALRLGGTLVWPAQFDAPLDAATIGEGDVEVLGPDADLDAIEAR